MTLRRCVGRIRHGGVFCVVRVDTAAKVTIWLQNTPETIDKAKSMAV